MKILIISASNPYKTAGVVALDLYNGLSAINGNEVKVLVKMWDRYTDKNVISLEGYFEHYKNLFLTRSRILFNKLGLTFNKTNINYSVQDYKQTVTYYSTNELLKRVNYTPDAILVLFAQRFLSYKNLYELNEKTKAPIYLCMVDMASMTGGCHYAWDCKGYLNKCGNCPAMYSDREIDQSRRNWEFKMKYVEKTNLTAITGSEWQYRQLTQSSLFKNKNKFKILGSINNDIFCPGNKEQARKFLKLPSRGKIVFFGANNVSMLRKGYRELIESLKILYDLEKNSSNIHLAIAGGHGEALKDNIPFGCTLLGHLNHNQLAKAFQAADVFVSPSIEDSGPTMVNQSVMCGTPVVAFETGVALDLVITDKTGYLAKLKDCVDLARGIKTILELNKEEYNNMSKNCSELGLKLCHHEVQANAFMQIFKGRTS